MATIDQSRYVYSSFDSAPPKTDLHMTDAGETVTLSVNAQTHKFFSSFVTITDEDTGGALQFLNYPSSDDGTFDFTEGEPPDAEFKVPSFAEQEAADGSDFSSTVSVLSIAHLTPALLNCIGKPLPGDATYLCVLPPLPSPSSGETGRAHVGLAVHRTTKAFVAYRVNADATTSDVLQRKALKQHFSMYFENLVLRELVLAASNKRRVEVMIPLETAGLKMSMNIPYMPTSLYQTLKAEHKKANAKPEPEQATVAAASADGAAATAIVVVDHDDDEDQDDVATQYLKQATTLNPLQQQEHINSSKFVELEPPTAKRARTDEDAASRRVSVLLPATGRLLANGDDISLSTLAAHFAVLFATPEHQRLRPLFADMHTMGAALRDPRTSTAIMHWALVTEALMPELFNLAPTVDVPDGTPIVKYADFFPQQQ